MGDNLVRATIDGVRIYAVDNTNMVEEACRRHNCWALAAAALGRTMTGALLLSATFKENERLTIKIEGNGPIGTIMSDAGNMTARGYVENSQVELPLKNGKINVGAGVGKGKITVTRFVNMKTPVSASVELVSGEIAEDITNYFYVSEQIPTCVSLGVLVGKDGTVIHSGGFFVQAMPEADNETLRILESNINELPSITVMLEECLTTEEIIYKICGADLHPVIHDTSDVFFKCSCSRNTVAKMLISLPKEDIQEIAEDEQTEISCNFCSSRYLFTKKEIQSIINY